MRATRFFPSSFDPKDRDLRGIPRAASWQWKDVEHALSECGSRGVMMRLPLFWQLEIPLAGACKNVGAYLFVNDRANMPVGAEALARAGIDCVVTDAGDVETFAAFLAEHGVAQPRCWIIIHDIAQPLGNFDRRRTGGARIAHEAHLFPGFPVLVQCRTLRDQGDDRMHLVDDYHLETNKRGTVLFGGDERYELPRPLVSRGVCTCGKPLYEL